MSRWNKLSIGNGGCHVKTIRILVGNCELVVVFVCGCLEQNIVLIRNAQIFVRSIFYIFFKGNYEQSRLLIFLRSQCSIFLRFIRLITLISKSLVYIYRRHFVHAYYTWVLATSNNKTMKVETLCSNFSGFCWSDVNGPRFSREMDAFIFQCCNQILSLSIMQNQLHTYL